MIISSPNVLLAKLTPMRSVLCIVGCSREVFGLALSDPYLGSARPLEDASDLSAVNAAIDDHGVGALAFALPMQRKEFQSKEARLLRLRDSLMEHSWNVPIACTIDDRLKLEEARKLAMSEIEQWEEVDFDNHSLSTDAAVALNHFLWVHIGGWRNTFG